MPLEHPEANRRRTAAERNGRRRFIALIFSMFPRSDEIFRFHGTSNGKLIVVVLLLALELQRQIEDEDDGKQKSGAPEGSAAGEDY